MRCFSPPPNQLRFLTKFAVKILTYNFNLLDKSHFCWNFCCSLRQLDYTATICITNAWNPNIVLFGHFFVQFSNGLITWLGGPLKNQTFLTKNTHFVRFSDHHLKTRPFDIRTHLKHPNTRLIRYSDGYCTVVSIGLFCVFFMPFHKVENISDRAK